MQRDGSEEMNWLERAIVESYNNLKAEFEGAEKREVVARITSLSFLTFTEKAKIKFVKGMEMSKYPEFIDYVMKYLTIRDET
jgi:hypothetical protein